MVYFIEVLPFNRQKGFKSVFILLIQKSRIIYITHLNYLVKYSLDRNRPDMLTIEINTATSPDFTGNISMTSSLKKKSFVWLLFFKCSIKNISSGRKFITSHCYLWTPQSTSLLTIIVPLGYGMIPLTLTQTSLLVM